ncbi:hypothetical protein KA529_03855 [Candidatus Saccharibacteria bacterium]|nr:hypothetical protein [Candidatus Saccharibacteria bacterium]
MKLTDYLAAAAIGLLVGVLTYFSTANFLFNSDHFKAEIEVVKDIDSSFNTESTDLFTTDSRVDYSNEVELNTARNSKPFNEL